MAVYAIGDVQGCYDELMALLKKVEFKADRDRLWFAGDLVNRGPKSLQVLRFVKSLGDGAVTVLGNHDLHLLALSQGNRNHYKRSTLDKILEAPDRDELIDWLRHRPLMHQCEKRCYSLVHAGLAPQWDIETALDCAKELEQTLRGPGFHSYCQNMYGNQPDLWNDNLKGLDRLRFITNAFTRLRYCSQDGRLSLREKGAPNTQSNGFIPWFEVAKRASRNDRIIFGHWSTLGYYQADNIWCLDSGCLWGGELTALRVRKSQPPRPVQLKCTGAMKPGKK